jgi:NAD+ kinase
LRIHRAKDSTVFSLRNLCALRASAVKKLIGDNMKTVALVVNTLKKDARSATGEIVPFLKELGVAVISDRETAEAIADPGMGRDAEHLRAEADLLVAIGGDGTVLKAARMLEGAQIPLMGINLGGLGFLTATTLGGAKELLGKVLRGDYRAEERLLLTVTLRRNGRDLFSHVALNDAVIAMGSLSRLITLETFIDDEYLVTYNSDGLIVSSPTGSTAYSLSAGGPLVTPDTDAIIVAPICPHMLTNRPLVVPSGKRVRIVISPRAQSSVLTLDGQVRETLEGGDEVVVGGCNTRLRLVVSTEKGYFQLLREKLHWGGRAFHG